MRIIGNISQQQITWFLMPDVTYTAVSNLHSHWAPLVILQVPYYFWINLLFLYALTH